MTVTDYPDWQTPQAHANAIATTGAPLLALEQLLCSETGVTLVPGVQQTYGPFPFTQISYECQVVLKCAAGETNPWLEIELLWGSTVGAGNVDEEKYYVGATNTASNFYRGLGRGKGNEVTFKVTWHGVDNTATFQFIAMQTSRQYIRDDWRSTGIFSGIIGYTAATYDLDGDCLCSFDESLPGSEGVAIPLPLYTGYVMLYATTSGASILSMQNTAQTTVKGLAIATTEQINEAAAATIPATLIVLGRGQQILNLINLSAATITFSGNMIVLEQEV